MFKKMLIIYESEVEDTDSVSVLGSTKFVIDLRFILFIGV